jgi:hypothetical protein
MRMGHQGDTVGTQPVNSLKSWRSVGTRTPVFTVRGPVSAHWQLNRLPDDLLNKASIEFYKDGADAVFGPPHILRYLDKVGITMLVFKLTEARKFSRDDRLRSIAPRPEATRLKMPAVSGPLSPISVVVAHHRADGTRYQHCTIGIDWRYDERDRCSKAQGHRSTREVRVDTCSAERHWARSASRRICASACSARGAGTVRTTGPGAPFEKLLRSQDIVS